MAKSITERFPVDGSSAKVAGGSSGEAISVSLSATTSDQRHYLKEIVYSIETSPSSNVSLGVFDGASSSDPELLNVDVSQTGFFEVDFPPMRGSPNTAMLIKMSSGGGLKHLNVFSYIDD